MEEVNFISFVSVARQQTSSKNYVTAFNIYIHIVDMYPKLKKEIENEFRSFLLKMNEELEFEHSQEDILQYILRQRGSFQ